MKNNYDDIDELIRDMETDIENTLMNEVLDTVRNIEIEHVKDDVFSVYHPKIYERRPYDGLDDPLNIIGTINGKMSMTVDNITEFDKHYGTYNYGRHLAELVNDGNGSYYYDYDGEFTMSRPFHDNTANEIESTNAVEDALEAGMKKIGYDIK